MVGFGKCVPLQKRLTRVAACSSRAVGAVAIRIGTPAGFGEWFAHPAVFVTFHAELLARRAVRVAARKCPLRWGAIRRIAVEVRPRGVRGTFVGIHDPVTTTHRSERGLARGNVQAALSLKGSPAERTRPGEAGLTWRALLPLAFDPRARRAALPAEVACAADQDATSACRRGMTGRSAQRSISCPGGVGRARVSRTGCAASSRTCSAVSFRARG